MNENNNLNAEPVINNSPVPIAPTTEPIINTNPVPVQPMTEPVVNSNPVPPTPVLVNNQNDRFQVANDVNTEPVAVPQPQQVPVQQPAQPTNNTMVNENLKKVEIKDYTPPSKAKVILLLIFFVLLVVFILFLPNISSMIRNYRSGVYYQKDEVITTGKLVCTKDTNTKDLDKDYEFTFRFTDSKLQSIKYFITTKGDSTSDNLVLDELNETCGKLEEETNDLEGVSIHCNYSEGKLLETQTFDLEKVDVEKLDAAFTEAGGMLPGYQFNQDIDSIEKNMKASGYTCERQK